MVAKVLLMLASGMLWFVVGLTLAKSTGSAGISYCVGFIFAVVAGVVDRKWAAHLKANYPPF